MVSQRRLVARSLGSWLGEGRNAVLATVVASSDSAPRGLGAQLAIVDDELWVGGLSGGCAEVAVLDAARELLAQDDAAAARVIEMTRDVLGSVGPVCGATLQVLVERVDGELAAHLAAAVAELVAPAAGGVQLVRRYVRGDDDQLRRSSSSLEPVAMPIGERIARTSWNEQELEWSERIPPSPRLVIGGAGDVAAELIRIGGQLGWRTVLVDPRSAFLSHTLSIATPDLVVASWPREAFDRYPPDGRTACLAAAHDGKLDTPFLAAALASEAFYVGAIGSRVVQHERREELATLVAPESVERLHGPAGLDLGGSTAAEIALSVSSEVLATWNARSGGELRSSRETIRAR